MWFPLDRVCWPHDVQFSMLMAFGRWSGLGRLLRVGGGVLDGTSGRMGEPLELSRWPCLAAGSPHQPLSTAVTCSQLSPPPQLRATSHSANDTVSGALLQQHEVDELALAV